MSDNERQFEILDNLPPVSVDSVFRQVKACHPHETDFDEGDLEDRIYCFSSYKKGIIDLRGLNLHEFDICEQTVEEYKALYKANGPGPELVYDPVNNSLIDGNHRANAAFELGVYYVEAFIGDADTYEPVLECEEECEMDEEDEVKFSFSP